MQNIHKKRKQNKREKRKKGIINLGYLVDGSETTFPNFVCSIKVVSGSPDLFEGKETSLQIQCFQFCQKNEPKMFHRILQKN